jgi:DNA polymerase-3 subunit gamma/tau
MDVIEMDAASNTGVDDVREIIEAVRYGPTSARTKIYIIDEVHMLSRNAFNALLKTLEEPPAHVKFIFATTEVEKLPPTILSRCQRFDLRRVPHALLVEHFSRIVAAERVEAEPQALELVALAADGSVRDGLSILDQAIARCDGQVTADAVRDMLGLADRGAVAAILDAVLAADAPAALAAFATAHDAGADPAALMEGLLALVHATMRTILAGAPDPALGEGEQAAVARWAADLDVTLVHRLWQLALKGLEDIRAAPRADHAAEMALLRMAHGSGLPDPGALLHPHADAPGAAATSGGLSALAPAGAPAAEVPADLAGLAALLASAHEVELARALTDCVGLIEFRPGALRLQARGMLPDRFGAELGSALGRLTGLDWKVELNRDGPAAETLREAEARVAADRTAAVRADARVQALLDTFPGSEVITVAAPAASDAVETRSAKK